MSTSQAGQMVAKPMTMQASPQVNEYWWAPNRTCSSARSDIGSSNATRASFQVAGSGSPRRVSAATPMARTAQHTAPATRTCSRAPTDSRAQWARMTLGATALSSVTVSVMGLEITRDEIVLVGARRVLASLAGDELVPLRLRPPERVEELVLRARPGAAGPRTAGPRRARPRTAGPRTARPRRARPRAAGPRTARPRA